MVAGNQVELMVPDGPTFPFTTAPDCSCTLQLDSETIAHGQLSEDGQSIQWGPVLNDDTWLRNPPTTTETTTIAPPTTTTAKTTTAPPTTTTAAPTTAVQTTTAAVGCNFDGQWQSTNVFGGYPLTVTGNQVSVQDGPEFPFTEGAGCSCTIQLDYETIAQGQLSDDGQIIQWGPVLNEDIWTRGAGGEMLPETILVV